MAINANIALGYQQPHFDNPLDNAGKGLGLQHLMLQNADLQRAAQTQSQLATLFRAHPEYADQATGLPTPEGIKAVYALDPPTGMKLAQQLQTGQQLGLQINHLGLTNRVAQQELDDRTQKKSDAAELNKRNAYVAAHDLAKARGATDAEAVAEANKIWGPLAPGEAPPDINAIRPLVTSPKQVADLQEKLVDNTRQEETSNQKDIKAQLKAEGLKEGTPEFTNRFAKEMKKLNAKKEAPTAVMMGSATPPLGGDAAFWYEYYDKTKTLPPMAWGQAGNPTREAFLKGFPEWKRAQGGTASDTATSQAEFRANAQSLNALTKDINTFQPYKKMLDTNADIAIQLGKKIYQTDAALVNKPLNWLRQNATSNPDVAEYLAQIRFVQTETARVINNPRIVGQLTNEARMEMADVINGNASIAVVERVLNRIKSDGTNRFDAMRQQQQGIINQLKGGVVDPESGAIVKSQPTGNGGQSLQSETGAAVRLSATNPKTGEKLYSDDGGKTWHK